MKKIPYEGFPSQEKYDEALRQATEMFKHWIEWHFLSGYEKLDENEREALYKLFTDLHTSRRARVDMAESINQTKKKQLSQKQEIIENLQAKLN